MKKIVSFLFALIITVLLFSGIPGRSDFDISVSVRAEPISNTRTTSIKYEQSIIFSLQGKNGYFAWPSVESIGGNRLLAVSSGYRGHHLSFDGKVVGWISENNGETWSEPFIVADTALDDRDAGVIYWKGKIIVTWFTRKTEGVSATEEAKYLGANYVVSEDGGNTWSEPKLMPVFSPHGFIEGPDGELVYVGYSNYDSAQGGFTQIGMITSTDGKNWSDVKVIADYNEKLKYGFDEPHAVFNDDGKLIVQLRTTADGIYQCESDDYGESFTDFHLICDAKDTPPHLLKLDDGTLLLTYGARTKPYGIRTRYSYDGGVTWTNERIITSDGPDTDMGYPDTVLLSNGKLLTVYYQRRTGADANTSIMQVVWEIPEKPVGKTIKINFNSMGGSEVESISGVFGTAATKPAAPTRNGYAFAGWYSDSKCLQEYTFSIFSDDITLYAKWVERPVPQLKNNSYLRDATAEELSASGYSGSGDAYMYMKPKGVAANDGGDAEMWIDSAAAKGNTLTFLFYIQDWLTDDDVVIEIDCKNFSGLKPTCVNVAKKSDGSVPKITKDKNGYLIAMDKKTWYEVTVDMSFCIKMDIFCPQDAGMNAIIGDIALTDDDMKHNWINATCTSPKMCSVCEKTVGKEQGHNWEDSNKGKVCSKCGILKDNTNNQSKKDATVKHESKIIVYIIVAILVLGVATAVILLIIKKRSKPI